MHEQNDITALLDQWPSQVALARDIGRRPEVVRMWRHRGRIPAECFPDLVASARRFRIAGVTLERLHDMHKDTAA